MLKGLINRRREFQEDIPGINLHWASTQSKRPFSALIGTNQYWLNETAIYYHIKSETDLLKLDTVSFCVFRTTLVEITRKYFSIWLPTISRERPYILVEEGDVFPYLTCNYRVVYDVSGARGIWQKWGKVLDITKNVIFAEFFGIFSVFFIIEGN